MGLGRSKRREAREALRRGRLQGALKKASDSHFAKFASTREDIPWEEIKAKARAIREECLPQLGALLERFQAEAEKAGARVHRAAAPEDALETVEAILRARQAKLIVKAKSMVSEEIGLNAFLEKRGYRVVETDLGEWIVHLAGERPSHITAPALHKTKEEVADLLSKHLGRPVPPDIQEMVKIARGELRRIFFEADAGISGANFAVAESGTLVLVSNEGNARLVTTLPPVHIALVTAEKLVATLEQATTLLKALITGSSGLKMTSYVSLITGPSKTTDIEKELVVGVHGPEELHIVILDNGRLDISLDDDLKEILYCLKCGGCMLHCPVFQAVGGYVYGGPVYPGGIGALLTAVTRSPREAEPLLDLCADCRKCESFCPVGIPTSELILRLKNRKGAGPGERVISGIFRRKGWADAGVRLLAVLQKLWMTDGHLRKLPTAWARGRLFPRLAPRKTSIPAVGRGRPKAYLFQGCLAKYVFPEIRESVLSVLAKLGYDPVCPEDQVCCGAPSHHLGDLADVRRLMKKNLRSFEKANPAVILTICPTGHSILKELYPEIDPAAAAWAEKTRDFTRFMVENGHFAGVEGAANRGDVFYHHPCHALNDPQLKDEPLKLLGQLGYKPKSENEPYTCCGFCGVFQIKNPEISAAFLEKKKAVIEATGSSRIATDCPGCVFQLKAGLAGSGKKYAVVHTAELCAERLEETTSAPAHP